MIWPPGTRVEAICDVHGHGYTHPKGTIGTCTGNSVPWFATRLGMDFCLIVDGFQEDASISIYWRPIPGQGTFGSLEETKESLVWAKDPVT